MIAARWPRDAPLEERLLHIHPRTGALRDSRIGDLPAILRRGDLLVVNETIRDMIKANPDIAAIRAAAVKGGLHTLFEDGSRLVIEGETSLQELLRVAK